MLLLLSIRKPTVAGTSSAENISSGLRLRIVDDRERLLRQAGDVAAAAIANRNMKDDELRLGLEGGLVLRQASGWVDVKNETKAATRIGMRCCQSHRRVLRSSPSHFQITTAARFRIMRLPASEPSPINANNGSGPAVWEIGARCGASVLWRRCAFRCRRGIGRSSDRADRFTLAPVPAAPWFPPRRFVVDLVRAGRSTASSRRRQRVSDDFRIGLGRQYATRQCAQRSSSPARAGR